MLYEICKYLKNFFLVQGAVRTGTFRIIDGVVDLPFLANGQYYLVEGSVFNDGVHRYGDGSLEDETFTGDIAPMAIPKAFLTMVEEIEAWQKENGKESTGALQSENFAGTYSYTKATGKSGGAYTWKDAFRSRLNTWRKL